MKSRETRAAECGVNCSTFKSNVYQKFRDKSLHLHHLVPRVILKLDFFVILDLVLYIYGSLQKTPTPKERWAGLNVEKSDHAVRNQRDRIH